MSQEGYYIHGEEPQEKHDGFKKHRLFALGACALLSLGIVVHGIPWTTDMQPVTATDTSLIGAMGTPRVAMRAPMRAGVSALRGPAPVYAIKQMDMPALSSTMTEGKVVDWIKQPGDPIEKGDAIVVIESDKADMEVEAFHDGFLGAIAVEAGESAPVGTPIAYIAETEDEIAEAKSKVGAGGPAPAPPPPAAAAPEPAPAAAAPSPAPAPAPPPAVVNDGRIVATPAAKNLAKTKRIDLATVKGTGAFGRITLTDVELAAGMTPSASKPAPAPAAGGQPAAAAAPKAALPPPANVPGGFVPFSAMEKAVSSNMMATKAMPEFRVARTIRMDAFEALYRKLKPNGVTLTALIAKAVGIALAPHPKVNAKYSDESGGGYYYNDHINVAIAVAMPDGGLITPVLKDADKTNIQQLSVNWADLVKRARGKSLKPDEYNTGTFTVSNLGMLGVDNFGALLPVGTGAILAVGGTKPVVAADKDGRIGIERQMTVTLTADHRTVYGADSAEFLKTLAEVMENPEVLNQVF